MITTQEQQRAVAILNDMYENMVNLVMKDDCVEPSEWLGWIAEVKAILEEDRGSSDAEVKAMYAVLTDGEPCWLDYDEAGNERPVYFPTYEDALAELMEHVNTLNEQGMDYDATEFTIKTINP